MGTVAPKPPFLLNGAADSQGFAADPAHADATSTFQPLIDALEQNVAILDDSGTIVRVNAAWKAAARQNGWGWPRAGIGMNYLRVYDASEDAFEVAEELRAILAGRCASSRLLCGLPAGGVPRPVVVTMSALATGDRRWIMVLHGDAHGPAGEVGAVAPQQRLRIEFEERRRIARDLHDSTSQHLTAIELLLMSAYRRVQDPSAERLIREAVQETVHALREMRSFSFLLHPPVIEGGGLAEALESFIRGYSRRIELPIAFTARIDAPEALAPLEAALFRVTQEALANIHRHADATEARVLLASGPDEVMLVVEDDGCGIACEPGAPGHPPGVGIAAMKERVEEFGGWLDIESPGKGTRLTARIPLRSERYRRGANAP